MTKLIFSLILLFTLISSNVFAHSEIGKNVQVLKDNGNYQEIIRDACNAARSNAFKQAEKFCDRERGTASEVYQVNSCETEISTEDGNKILASTEIYFDCARVSLRFW